MPDTVVIDIKTRFIPNDRKVFILFPGNGYRYYDFMAERSGVFIDVRGFVIPRDRRIRGLPDIVERIAISDAVVEWHRKGRPADNPPPRQVEELGQIRRTARRKFLAGMLQGFFSDVRKGDVVILP